MANLKANSALFQVYKVSSSSSESSTSSSSSNISDTALRRFNRLLRTAVARHWTHFRQVPDLKSRGRSISDAGLCAIVDNDSVSDYLGLVQSTKPRRGRSFKITTSATVPIVAAAAPKLFLTKMKIRKGHVKGQASNESKPMEPRSFIAKKFEEFCNRTDLHGYKYIIMKDLTVIERSCWAAAVLISIVFAVYFVFTAYNWYARNPIVTVIESTHGAIWDIPFPAVTICDVNQISRKKAKYFSENIKLPANVTSDDIFENIRIAPLLHGGVIVKPEQKEKLATLQKVLDMNSINIVHLFTKLSRGMSCNELVERCMWKNTVYRCELLFHKILTEFGLCCTFNFYALRLKDGRPYNGIPNTSELFRPPTPRRVASCGYQTALTVLLKNDPNDYYSAAVASYGMLVLIHNAYEFPNHDSTTRLISPGVEMFIALTPEQTYATRGIRSFPVEKRRCYYSDEFGEGIFRLYTFHNCMIYRRVELVKKFCECIPFYHPTESGVDGYRKCNFSDMDCLKEVVSPLEINERENHKATKIKCLPDCEHYDYPLEVAVGILADEAPLDGLAFFKGVDLVNKSLLNVFFNDLVSTKYRRDVYLNWQNLLASFGGLLSLMLGFTLISVIDFIIFFTFRVAYDAMKPAVTPEGKGDQKVKDWKVSNQIYFQELRMKNNWISEANENNMPKY